MHTRVTPRAAPRPRERRLRHVAGLLAVAVLVSPGQVSGSGTEGDALSASADEAMRARRYEEAAGALEKLVEMSPGDVDGWLRLGIARAALRDFDGAKTAYGKVIELEPEVHVLGRPG